MVYIVLLPSSTVCHPKDRFLTHKLFYTGLDVELMQPAWIAGYTAKFASFSLQKLMLLLWIVWKVGIHQMVKTPNGKSRTDVARGDSEEQFWAFRAWWDGREMRLVWHLAQEQKEMEEAVYWLTLCLILCLMEVEIFFFWGDTDEGILKIHRKMWLKGKFILVHFC